MCLSAEHYGAARLAALYDGDLEHGPSHAAWESARLMRS